MCAIFLQTDARAWRINIKCALSGPQPVRVSIIGIGLVADREAQKHDIGDAGDRVCDGEQRKGGEDDHGRLPAGV